MSDEETKTHVIDSDKADERVEEVEEQHDEWATFAPAEVRRVGAVEDTHDPQMFIADRVMLITSQRRAELVARVSSVLDTGNWVMLSPITAAAHGSGGGFASGEPCVRYMATLIRTR